MSSGACTDSVVRRFAQIMLKYKLHVICATDIAKSIGLLLSTCFCRSKQNWYLKFGVKYGKI